MTDTPRTKAELLALFANNTTHDISPQNLRDLVVSLATPVANSGLDLLEHQMTLSVDHRVAAGGSGVTQAIAPNTFPAIDYSADRSDVTDPQGWLQATSQASNYYEDTVPAYSWLSLPPGLYLWSLYAVLTSSPVSGQWNCFADYIDYDELTFAAPNDSWYGWFWPDFQGALGRYNPGVASSVSFVSIPRLSRTATPVVSQKHSTRLNYFGDGTTRQLDYSTLIVQQIG